MPVISFRASMAGMCSRAIAARALGYEADQPSSDQMVTFGIGHALEQIGRDLARVIGWEVTDPKSPDDFACVLQGADGWLIKGHLDGKASRNGGRLVAEVKTMGWFASFRDAVAHGVVEACPMYDDQAQVYMAAEFLPRTLFVLLDKDHPLYTLAVALLNGAQVPDWTYPKVLEKIIRDERVSFQEIEANQRRVDLILEKHARIAAAVRAGQLPPPDQNPKCSWCSYGQVCEERIEPAGDKVLTVDDDPEIEAKLLEFGLAKAEADAAAERAKDLGQKLHLHVAAREARKAAGAAGTFTLIQNKGRSRLNKDRIPADIYHAALERGKPYWSHRWTPAKPEGGTP
ncbi:MAG: PD-(D/E)XK nuclease family protein [Proteobacteria bacterium]|nr:PD-(D/E)XK nuclease family protein [Pseudomonadota bacterium]